MAAAVQHKDPAAEAAMKMSTDCVYFLASPLTCKKGIKCEYRHSDAARLNPRDCWYWVNRKCLNPNCFFRHPPLEAFLGSQGTEVKRESPSTLAQPVFSMAMPAPLRAPAQGLAVGGAPKVPSKQNVPCYYFQQGYCNKAEKCPFLHGPQPVTASVTFSSCQPPKTFDQSAPPQPNTSVNVHNASQNDTYQTIFHRTTNADTDTIRSRAGNSIMTSDSSQDRRATSLRLIHSLAAKQSHGGILSSQVSYAQGTNGLKSGKSLRRSTPSFDVLVNAADGKLYSDADEFRLNRSLRRPRSSEGTRDSDLRNRLSKQRRFEGMPRSDNGPNYDHIYDDRSRRDQHPYFNSIKNNTSSCLQGRLKLTAEVYNGRAKELRRPHKNGLSNSRLRQSVDAGKQKMRSMSRRHDMNKFVDFNAPKTLAELKGAKVSVGSEGPTSDSNKRVVDSDLSFDCPKPLKILFQKNQENVFSNDGTESSTAEKNNQVGSEDVQVFDDRTAVLHAEPVAPLSSGQDRLEEMNDIKAGDDNQVGEEAFEEEYYNDYSDGGEEYVEDGMEVDGGHLNTKDIDLVSEIEAIPN